MGATERVIVAAGNPSATEANLAKQIRGEVDRLIDADSPVKHFEVVMTVTEVEDMT